MRASIVAVGLIAVVASGAGFASYVVRDDAAIQGRQAPPQTPPGQQAVPRQTPPPTQPTQPRQPTQPAQPTREKPPQQTPRQAPPGTPPGDRAVPRPPTPEPPRPGGPGARVPPYSYPTYPTYPSYPWFWFQYYYLYPNRYLPSPRWYWPVTLSGRLRLEIDQKDASVYVDGYYVGIVDDFDGFFQHLTLSAGPHTIEVRKPGYVPLAVDVDIPIDQTVTYRDRMVVARPGETDILPAPLTGSEAADAASAWQATPGDVRLEVTPKDAKVYVDGYYVGSVDDFDGRLQRLTVSAGPHHIVIQANGYEQLEVDLYVQPRQTLTYRGALKKSSE